MTGRLLTPEELAARWSVPKSHIYRLARAGAVPTVRLGKYVRVHPAAIEAFERGDNPKLAWTSPEVPDVSVDADGTRIEHEDGRPRFEEDV
jgi:excisionase family DNA binding protein